MLFWRMLKGEGGLLMNKKVLMEVDQVLSLVILQVEVGKCVWIISADNDI